MQFYMMEMKELAYILSVTPYQDTYNNYAQICTIYLLQGSMFETVLI